VGGDRSKSARADADVQSPEEVVGLEADPGLPGAAGPDRNGRTPASTSVSLQSSRTERRRD